MYTAEHTIPCRCSVKMLELMAFVPHMRVAEVALQAPDRARGACGAVDNVPVLQILCNPLISHREVTLPA